MKKDKLFHRDFTLMVLGQIISLFGNSILRFSLSLYVLDKTGSAAIFGGILAISMIPTIILSPFGGLLADRVNRRNIMVALDYTTAVVIAGFALFFFGQGIIPIAVVMVLLSVIQSFYQPSVQSSIPILASDKNLERANGTVIQVNALANLLGPILAGFLYGFLGIKTILLASGICFFFSACMELFLRIPFVRQPQPLGILDTVKCDLREAVLFLVREQPQLLKLLGVIAAINLFLSAMVMVGLPYLVKVYLGLSSRHYGFAEGMLAVGTILAGCISGFVAKRWSFRDTYRLISLAGIALLPMGAAVLTPMVPSLSYGVILLSVLACMLCASLYTIFAQSFAQRQTPVLLLGKVSSLISTVSICALPLGQAMYGMLFDRIPYFVSLIVFFAGGMSVLMGIAAGKIQQSIPA